MDNKKTDQYYIKKIVTDLAFILEHTNGLTKADLEANEILIDSVMFRLIQVAENSGKKQIVKWTAEGAVKGETEFFAEYSATCGHTSVAGDMQVSRKCTAVIAVNQGGTADNAFIRP